MRYTYSSHFTDGDQIPRHESIVSRRILGLGRVGKVIVAVPHVLRHQANVADQPNTCQRGIDYFVCDKSYNTVSLVHCDSIVAGFFS